MSNPAQSVPYVFNTSLSLRTRLATEYISKHDEKCFNPIPQKRQYSVLIEKLALVPIPKKVLCVSWNMKGIVFQRI